MAQVEVLVVAIRDGAPLSKLADGFVSATLFWDGEIPAGSQILWQWVLVP